MGYQVLWLSFLLSFATVIECDSNVNNDVAMKQQTTHLMREHMVEKVFLKRKKRFLIFEKGSSYYVQANIAKSVIILMPRGLNQITEFTASYDLPWEIVIPKRKQEIRPPTKVSTKLKTTTLNSPMWVNQHNEPFYVYDHHKWKTPRPLWCPNEHVFHKYYDSYGRKSFPWCAEKVFKRKNGRKKRESIRIPLLFDLITHLADLHGYNARHCIMRTLCESQHLLFPPGRLLFHDLVRILLSHAQTATQRHAPFLAAIHRENLQECIQLYGLHCRWSFLQHFTESIAMAANSIGISPMLPNSIEHSRFM